MNLEHRVDALEDRMATREESGCDACSFAGGYEILMAAYCGLENGWQIRDTDEWPPGGEDGWRLLRVCQECGRRYEAVVVRWPDGY